MKDFTKTKEKGVMDCDKQNQPIHLLELFGGIGAPRRALENTFANFIKEQNPDATKKELRQMSSDCIKSIDYVEVLPYAVRAYNQMFDLSNRTQDIRLWNLAVDLLIHGSPCFTGDTLVLTKEHGYVQIKDIKAGEHVLTHKNRYRKVLNTFDNGEKAIIEMVTSNSDVLRTTANHRFYVRKKYLEYSAETQKEKRNFTAPEWRCADQIMEGENERWFVGYAVNNEGRYPAWEGVSCTRGKTSYVKNNLDMHDEGLWYMAGRYVGDGWIRVRHDRNDHLSNVIICCGKAKTDIFKSMIPEAFHYYLMEEATVSKFTFCNKEFAAFCALFGRGAKNKAVPAFVFDLPRNAIKAFLNGYFDSDGCKIGNVKKATTTSRELAYGIVALIAKLYHVPFSVYKEKRPKEYVIEGRTVNQSDTYTVVIRDTERHEAFFENGYLWFPIKKIYATGEKESVYDIEVEEDHSFTANGCIAHNCQDFSREGKNDVNSGRSILYERTLQILDPNPAQGFRELVTQPKLVIWENVPNMAYSHPDVLEHYLRTMENYGYTNTFCGSKKYLSKGGYASNRSLMVEHMLDASDYGIPQARERFFCVSVLNDLADRFDPFVMPKPVPEDKRYTLKQFLDLSADMDAKENQFTPTELSITKKVGCQWYVRQAVQGDFGAGPGYVPINDYQRVDLAFPNSKNRRGRVGDYASTLTTSPRQGVLIGDKFRTFTAKEKLRLMGFRDVDYEKMVKAGLTDKQISLLAGNSICVPVLEHIFDAAFRQYPELIKDVWKAGA